MRYRYIYFISKPRDLKFGLYVVKTKLYFMKPTDYTHHKYFLMMRVGSVLSRSELDPFLYIWYHTIQTKKRHSPCNTGDNKQVFRATVCVMITRINYRRRQYE